MPLIRNYDNIEEDPYYCAPGTRWFRGPTPPGPELNAKDGDGWIWDDTLPETIEI